MGYALHFLPFGVLERQAFLHYYLPAYYFGILTLATLIDMLPSTSKILVAATLLVAAVGIGVYVLPLSLGSDNLNYDQFISRAQWMTGECWYQTNCWCAGATT